MKIKIKKLLDGAKEAQGLAVVIDVIRASTTICSLLSKDVNKIITVGELNEAYKLKKENPGFVLMEERNALKPEGFDYGNSPSELEDVDLKNKTVILTTSNGTKGIVNAKNADEIIIGCFNNFNAVINYIKGKNSKTISLLALGSDNVNTPEDEIFAEYLKAKLENKNYDISNLKEKVKDSRSVRITTMAGYAEDIDYCLKFSLYNIVPKVLKENNMLVIKNAS